MSNKKVSIIFHSICGNNYLIAKNFYEQFKNCDVDVSIYRVEDSNFESLAEQFPIAGQYKDEIMNIKVANHRILSQAVMKSYGILHVSLLSLSKTQTIAL